MTHHIRRGARLLSASLVVAVALVVAITSLPALAAFPREGSARSAPSSSATAVEAASSGRPTIVLVHGAWADASGWAAQVAEFLGRGYDVIAPANPLRGVRSDAAYVSSLLAHIDGPVVLVGHSYGGAVISNAAVGHSNVKALVYVNGWVPDEGESIGQLATLNPGSLINEETLEFLPYAEGSRGDGVDIYIRREPFREAFAGDLPAKQAQVMAATQRPFSVKGFQQGSGPVAWRDIPSWYVLGTEDNAIPPATQRFMAKRAEAQITRVRASHVTMQSRAGVVNRVIWKAIRAVD